MLRPAKVVVAEVPGLDMKGLRELSDRLRDKLGDAVVFLASVSGDSLLMVAGSAGRAKGLVHAGKLVGRCAAVAGGKGGGRPDFGQAGAREPGKLREVLAEAGKAIREELET